MVVGVLFGEVGWGESFGIGGEFFIVFCGIKWRRCLIWMCE